MNTVKGLLEVNEVYVQGDVPFQTLLRDVAQGKCLLDRSSSTTEPYMLLSQPVNRLINALSTTLQKIILGTKGSRYPSPIFTISCRTLLWQLNNLRTFHQSLGMVYSSRILMKRSVSTLIAVLTFALNSS